MAMEKTFDAAAAEPPQDAVRPDAVRFGRRGRKQTGVPQRFVAGGDFALALDAELSAPLTMIGNIVGRTGLWQREQGKLKRLSPQGYVHGGQ